MEIPDENLKEIKQMALKLIVLLLILINQLSILWIIQMT